MGLFAFTDECVEAIDRWDGTVGAPNPKERRERIRVFRNPIVEDWLATSHPILPGVWFGPFIAVGLYQAVRTPWPGLLLFAEAVLAWTLLEYVLHRFVFHMHPTDDFASKARMYMMHGYHHDFPNDRRRLVAPPLMSWPLAVIVGGACWAMAPSYWLVLFGGVCAGYLAYDWTHYYTHHFRPRWRLGKYLRRFHLVHHFKEFELNHGISSPLWDLVFGTYAWKANHPRK